MILTMERRDSRVDKHEILIEKLVEQQIRFEEMLKVQIKRADTQEAALALKIKDDTNKDLELAKTLEGMKVMFSGIKWFAAAAGGFLIVDLLSHILIK